MATIRTNFIEILLKEILIGKYIYDDNGNKLIIDDINYQPLLQELYIKSGENGYKLSLNSNYDFDLTITDVDGRINPNKGKIKGKNKEL